MQHREDTAGSNVLPIILKNCRNCISWPPVTKKRMMKDTAREITVMGIVNITDNSYFASSRCLDSSGAPDMKRIIERIGRMLDEGAGIIDIGACSTRPGSEGVGAEEEWRRLAPVLGILRKEFGDIRISIDTYWASVAEKAFDTIGDFIINDISAGEDDPEMLPLAGKLGLEYVAMHKRGTPLTMQGMCDYGGSVTDSIAAYFSEFARKAENAGIRKWILDPGFGFAKTIDQNYELLRNLDRFNDFGRKILIGVSRKSMIYRLFGITPEESLPQTQVLHLAALERGADILRVHDVAEAARTVAVYRLLSDTSSR